jgi:hypothetical protein
VVWMRSANWNSGLVTLRSPPSTTTVAKLLPRFKLLPLVLPVLGDGCPALVGLRGGLCAA